MAQVCDHIAIMYAGKMVEYGTVEKIFQSPSHPYTRGLLSSIPKIDHPTGTKLSTIEGQVPDIHNYPNGCRFVNRCEFATKECDSFDMKLQPINNEQNVACLHPIKDS
jgi:oligopeptide/dipeptide ABC transporter ATP-binding protein